METLAVVGAAVIVSWIYLVSRTMILIQDNRQSNRKEREKILRFSLLIGLGVLNIGIIGLAALVVWACLNHDAGASNYGLMNAVIYTVIFSIVYVLYSAFHIAILTILKTRRERYER